MCTLLWGKAPFLEVILGAQIPFADKLKKWYITYPQYCSTYYPWCPTHPQYCPIYPNGVPHIHNSVPQISAGVIVKDMQQ